MSVRVWMDLSENVAGLYDAMSMTTLAHPMFRRDDYTDESAEVVAEAFLAWHRERWPLYDVRYYSPLDLASRVGQFHAWRDGQRVIGNFDGKGRMPPADVLLGSPENVARARAKVEGGAL